MLVQTQKNRTQEEEDQDEISRKVTLEATENPQDRSYTKQSEPSQIYILQRYLRRYCIDKIRRDYFDKGDQEKVIGNF